MPFWLVYKETYGIDFLTPSFVIYISKHYHHYQIFLSNVAMATMYLERIGPGLYK
jgi:hypothetical protein